MSNNKIDFINDLLSSSKIKIEEKNRILELTKSELMNFDNDNEDIKRRIDNIEEILNVTQINNPVSAVVKTLNYDKLKKTKEKLDRPLYAVNKVIYYTNSKNQTKFLQKLNNNNFTKFLTHDVDSTDYNDLKEQFEGKYDYMIHLKKIKEVFSVLTDKNSEFKTDFPDLEHISISKNLYKKIYNYIHNEEGWGEENIKMNWSHRDILNWCEQHSERTPSPGVDLGYEGFKYGDKTFKDLILDFKNEIHIRRNNSFDLILNKVLFEPINDFRSKFKVENDINNAIELFTDIEKLKQTIRLIFNLIIEKHQQEVKPEIAFTVKINDKKGELTILHKNSIYGQDIETLRFGNTSKNIMKVCNGMCDLEIKAEFSNGKFYSLPIWRYGRKIENEIIFENNKEVNPSSTTTELSVPINGVLYILTFDIGL